MLLHSSPSTFSACMCLYSCMLAHSLCGWVVVCVYLLCAYMHMQVGVWGVWAVGLCLWADGFLVACTHVDVCFSLLHELLFFSFENACMHVYAYACQCLLLCKLLFSHLKVQYLWAGTGVCSCVFLLPCELLFSYLKMYIHVCTCVHSTYRICTFVFVHFSANCCFFFWKCSTYVCNSHNFYHLWLQACCAVLQSWVSKKFMTGWYNLGFLVYFDNLCISHLCLLTLLFEFLWCSVVLFPVAVTFFITWWFIQFIDGFFSPLYERLGVEIFGQLLLHFRYIKSLCINLCMLTNDLSFSCHASIVSAVWYIIMRLNTTIISVCQPTQLGEQAWYKYR